MKLYYQPNFFTKLRLTNNQPSGRIFLKNSDGRYSFMSFSKICQLSTHATITNCEPYERQVFVKHIFSSQVKSCLRCKYSAVTQSFQSTKLETHSTG